MAIELAQITFTVPKVVVTNLAKRAAPMNIRASEYARRLFDAAYTARIAAERGEETGDRALERQVRDVFLLADCEPEFIAETLGLPVGRVSKILDGWRQVARELREGQPAVRPAPVAAAAPLPPPCRQEGQAGQLLARGDRDHPRHVARRQGDRRHCRGDRPAGQRPAKLGLASSRRLPLQARR